MLPTLNAASCASTMTLSRASTWAAPSTSIARRQ
jgi:hypothetical protein